MEHSAPVLQPLGTALGLLRTAGRMGILRHAQRGAGNNECCVCEGGWLRGSGFRNPCRFLASRFTSRIADAQLLFTADFHRAGPDLILTGHDGRHHIIPGYFATEKHPALTAPNGAQLSPDLVDSLAGSPTPNEYAQAQTDDAGRCHRQGGKSRRQRHRRSAMASRSRSMSATRSTKATSSRPAPIPTVGIGFPDGTALNFVANTRMALNDYSLRSECDVRQRRAVQPRRRHLLFRRRQGRAHRRHEDRDAGGDHGHSRHHRLCREAHRRGFVESRRSGLLYVRIVQRLRRRPPRRLHCVRDQPGR